MAVIKYPFFFLFFSCLLCSWWSTNSSTPPLSVIGGWDSGVSWKCISKTDGREERSRFDELNPVTSLRPFFPLISFIYLSDFTSGRSEKNRIDDPFFSEWKSLRRGIRCCQQAVTLTIINFLISYQPQSISLLSPSACRPRVFSIHTGGGSTYERC